MINLARLVALTVTGSAFAATPKLNVFPEGERLVYGRLIEAYRKNDQAEATKQRESLARNYPNSVYLGHAYYLSGTLAYQKEQLGEAVKLFGVVIDRYPRSSKRAGALFAKGMTYDKLGLRPQARRLWDEVVTKYPGSAEAARAAIQLKVKTN